MIACSDAASKFATRPVLAAAAGARGTCRAYSINLLEIIVMRLACSFSACTAMAFAFGSHRALAHIKSLGLREAHSSIVSRLRVLTHEELGQLDVRFVATSNDAVRLAAIAGGGIAYLSRALVKADILSGLLVRLAVTDFDFTKHLSIAYPADLLRRASNSCPQHVPYRFGSHRVSVDHG